MRSSPSAAAGWLLTILAIAASQLGTRAGAQDEASVERGRQVFAAECAMCHGRDATGMMGMHPALRGAVDRLGREGVEVTVRLGRNTMPPMPAFGDRLNEQGITDVIAYVETLPPGPRNFGPGEEGARAMGGMMRDMMGGGATALWIAIAILAAALAGLTGFLLGRQRT